MVNSIYEKFDEDRGHIHPIKTKSLWHDVSNLSIYLSMYLSIYVSTYLSVYLSR